MHNSLPPSRRGSHVKSDYARTIIQHSLLNPYSSHLRLDFQSLCSLHTFPQQHRVTANHPFQGDKLPKRWTVVQKTQKEAKIPG